MADTRFYEGYTWVSSSEDCKVGLCMPTTDPTKAALMYVSGSRRFQYRTKPAVCFTLVSPDALPVRHEVLP